MRPTLYHLGHEDNCEVRPKNWVYITNGKWGESLTPPFPLPGWRDFKNFSCAAYLNHKVYGKNVKSTVLIFHRVRGVSNCPDHSVKIFYIKTTLFTSKKTEQPSRQVYFDRNSQQWSVIL